MTQHLLGVEMSSENEDIQTIILKLAMPPAYAPPEVEPVEGVAGMRVGNCSCGGKAGAGSGGGCSCGESAGGGGG